MEENKVYISYNEMYNKIKDNVDEEVFFEVLQCVIKYTDSMSVAMNELIVEKNDLEKYCDDVSEYIIELEDVGADLSDICNSLTNVSKEFSKRKARQ